MLLLLTFTAGGQHGADSDDNQRSHNGLTNDVHMRLPDKTKNVAASVIALGQSNTGGLGRESGFR